MKSNKKTLAVTGAIAAAALTGLFASSASADVASGAGINSSSVAVQRAALAGTQAHGYVYNEAGHDCKGHNDCKGKGGCKSGDNGCKGKNSCKGKGGCKSSHE